MNGPGATTGAQCPDKCGGRAYVIIRNEADPEREAWGCTQCSNIWNAHAMPHDDCYFVFGSNLAGRHGRGAALTAVRQYGAVYGRGVGLMGNSYALPTKDERLNTLDLEEIGGYVRQFIQVAHRMHTSVFLVTKIGCGLAGWTENEISPMFIGAPRNCVMPREWVNWYEETHPSYQGRIKWTPPNN